MFVQNGRWSALSLWLLDFARRYHQAARLDALDISLAQVPDKEWLPSNIVSHLYDVHNVPPDDVVEKLHIVHVRHLTLVIKQNDPTVVIHNLVKMLSTFFPNSFKGNDLYPTDRSSLITNLKLTYSGVNRTRWSFAMGRN